MNPPVLRGTAVELRPIEVGDLEPLWELITAPEVSRWWDVHPRAARFEEWLEPDLQWAIVADGAVAGLIQAYEETEPDFRHAGVDLFVGTPFHGRRLGRDALRAVCRWLFEERGHHRLVIDPARANERAIHCYESVGFRPVGVMRAYWLDHTTGTWVDGVLLDLLVGELR